MDYSDYESADIGYVGHGESDEGASYDDYDDGAGESYAEFGSSWVHGGGSSYDVARAWNSGIAYRAGYLSAPQGEDFDERPEDMPVHQNGTLTSVRWTNEIISTNWRVIRK